MRRLLPCVLIAAACAVARPPATQPLPPRPPLPDWETREGLPHALAGRIWASGDGRFIDADELLERLRQRRFLLLGEKHDNPDHHLLQAWIIEALAASGAQPRLVLEMLSPVQTATLVRVRGEGRIETDALVDVLHWERTGWPPFEIYAPIFEQALRWELELGSANLSSTELESLRERGLNGLAGTFVDRFGLRRPLAPDQRAAIEQEIRDAHCGHAPDHAIPSMVRIQRVRDARMAERLLDADGAEPVVLIAGAGHIRRDRGVPIHLGLEDRTGGAAVLALLEVQEGERMPGAPRSAELYDYIWYTPRVDSQDPCEKFREQLERLRERPGPD